MTGLWDEAIDSVVTIIIAVSARTSGVLYLSGINKSDLNREILNSTMKKKLNSEVMSKDSNYVLQLGTK